MRLLLIEDNKKLSEWLSRLLGQRNYTVDQVHDGVSAEAALLTHKYDLVILDLDLPQMSGLELLKHLRQRGDRTAVLILTASNRVSDRVAGLDSGADDYLAKPFDIDELEARIRARLRRSHDRAAPAVRLGTLALDTNSGSFTVSEQELQLSPRERSVLELLMLHAGSVVSKERLAEAIYGFNEDANPSSIEIYVHRIRKKILDADIEIATLRGIGYVLRQTHGDHV